MPWAGITGFGAMASHIPDGGSCLIVYGPHVGVDSRGNVGKVNRPGQKVPDSCCGSAADAAIYVGRVYKGEILSRSSPEDCIDTQQAYLRNALQPHALRLDQSSDADVELPYALFDAADEVSG